MTYDDDGYREKPEVSDIDAEKFTLAAMMTSPQAIAECGEIVSPGDFYRPIHKIMFKAIVLMFAADEPVTPVTLRTYLAEKNQRFDPLYLAEIYDIPVTGAMGAAHARIVWDHAVRRNLEGLGNSLAQTAGYLSESPEELIGRAQQAINRMMKHMTPDDNQALTVGEFLAQSGRATQPVIPGLLDHQERVIVVGGEGSGKTTLAFQVGFAVASGQHPFYASEIPPLKVLIADLENPIEILKRRVIKLADYASTFHGWSDANMALWARPGGIDMTSSVESFKFAEVIRREQPDLIIAGPLYKMLPGGEVNEHQHAAVTRFFDVMRGRYDCAVWLETHAPMKKGGDDREMRPLGSGIYSRWPEFGISVHRDSRDKSLTLKRFRGDREEGRMWPDKLTRNPYVGWPWQAVYPPGTFTRQDNH